MSFGSAQKVTKKKGLKEEQQLADTPKPCGDSRKENPFSEAMRQQSRLGVLARGLESVGLEEQKDDFFYRGILTRSIIVEEAGMDDDLLDVGTEQAGQVDRESSAAEVLAREVHKTLFGETGCSDFDDGAGDLFDKLMEKVAMEPEEKSTCLRVLLKAIFSQRVLDVTASAQPVGAGSSVLYSNSKERAFQLRAALRFINEDCFNWTALAHQWLLRSLDVHLLSSYLNILRFLKVAGSGVGEFLVGYEFEDKTMMVVNCCIGNFLRIEISDPFACLALDSTSYDKLNHVELVIICSADIAQPRDSIFRDLFPQFIGSVKWISLPAKEDGASITDYVTSLLRLIRTNLAELVELRSKTHLFLAGWGTSALLNHVCHTEVSGLSGILDFAFPIKSVDGSRGTEGDDICKTSCPTLFVVGENAMDYDSQAMKILRKNMMTDTGLVVVGNASHDLLVSLPIFNLEKITQMCINRMIVECALEFIKKVIDCHPSQKGVTQKNADF